MRPYKRPAAYTNQTPRMAHAAICLSYADVPVGTHRDASARAAPAASQAAFWHIAGIIAPPAACHAQNRAGNAIGNTVRDNNPQVASTRWTHRDASARAAPAASGPTHRAASWHTARIVASPAACHAQTRAGNAIGNTVRDNNPQVMSTRRTFHETSLQTPGRVHKPNAARAPTRTTCLSYADAPVGTHRDASAVPNADAHPDSPADHLFAEGIALLDAGDHLGAADKVWQAAVTAMVTYSDARGWQPQDWHLHRKLLDIIKLRSEELGIPYIGTPYDTNPISDAYSAGNMLETHVHHDGHFLDLESVRREIKDTRPMLDYFRLD